MAGYRVNLDRVAKRAQERPVRTVRADETRERLAERRLHPATEQIDLLRRRAGILNTTDRALMLMYLEKGSCFNEIAQVAGLNEANVARRIHKLVRRLLDGEYVKCLHHRRQLGNLNLAIAKDRLIEGLSVRKIAEKRQTTVYRVRKGLVQIRLILDGRLKTKKE